MTIKFGFLMTHRPFFVILSLYSGERGMSRMKLLGAESFTMALGVKGMKKAVFMVVTVLLLGSCAGTGDGLRQSDFIRNAEMWESPGLREEGGFQLDVEYWR